MGERGSGRTVCPLAADGDEFGVHFPLHSGRGERLVIALVDARGSEVVGFFGGLEKVEGPPLLEEKGSCDLIPHFLISTHPSPKDYVLAAMHVSLHNAELGDVTC